MEKIMYGGIYSLFSTDYNSERAIIDFRKFKHTTTDRKRS